MKHVNRIKEIDLTNLGSTDYLNKRNQRSLGKLRNNPEMNLSILIDRTYNIMRVQLVVDKDSKSFLSSAKTAFALLSAEIKRRSSNDLTILNINGEEYHVAPTTHRYTSARIDWLKLFHLANIIGEDFLSEAVELASLLPKLPEDSFYTLLVEFYLDIVARDESRILNKLNELGALAPTGVTLNISENEVTQTRLPEAAETYTTILFPIAELYMAACQEEVETFQSKMLSYLQGRNYYIRSRKLEDNINFIIDFPAFGARSFARRRGVELNITSDYLPDIS